MIGASFFKPKREFPKRGANGFPIGKRAIQRAKVNRELAKSDIRSCEIQIKNVCARNIMLTWAHSKKSRFLTTGKLWREAARCCLPCHQIIEAMKHRAMAKIVRDAIAKRKVKP